MWLLMILIIKTGSLYWTHAEVPQEMIKAAWMPWQTGYQLTLKCRILTVVPVINPSALPLGLYGNLYCLPSAIQSALDTWRMICEHTQKHTHPRTSSVPFLPEFQCTRSSLQFIQLQWFCALAFMLAAPVHLYRSKVSLRYFPHLKKEHLNMGWRTPGSRRPFQSVVPTQLCW